MSHNQCENEATARPGSAPPLEAGARRLLEVIAHAEITLMDAKLLCAKLSESDEVLRQLQFDETSMMLMSRGFVRLNDKGRLCVTEDGVAALAIE